MEERLDHSGNEPDGSQRPVPLKQIRENEQVSASPDRTSDAGRTESTVPAYGEGRPDQDRDDGR